jgi:hypothetical protein
VEYTYILRTALRLMFIYCRYNALLSKCAVSNFNCHCGGSDSSSEDPQNEFVSLTCLLVLNNADKNVLHVPLYNYISYLLLCVNDFHVVGREVPCVDHEVSVIEHIILYFVKLSL